MDKKTNTINCTSDSESSCDSELLEFVDFFQGDASSNATGGKHTDLLSFFGAGILFSVGGGMVLALLSGWQSGALFAGFSLFFLGLFILFPLLKKNFKSFSEQGRSKEEKKPSSSSMQLELHALEAQKMQAVGQLAGGVAHDFNNLLTAITGFCDLLLERHGPKDPSFGDLMQIKQNANRAAGLVRQLLAFSRRQTLRPKILDVPEVLQEVTDLIRRLVGEDIRLIVHHGRNLARVQADQGQLEQVLVNLSVNARDAMPDGGELTIRTANISPADVKALNNKLMPKEAYVRISVEDTGAGISRENQDKIFDPFFTTKEAGKGTGLGLSTAYGIIKQSGGFIFVDSEPGQGTRFDIYLPAYEELDELGTAADQQEEKAVASDLTGKGTILIVEDEAPVRLFASRALASKGYEILTAETGEEALSLIEGHETLIDLMISDVVMPGMDGPTLVEQARQLQPGLKVIMISGYAEDNFRQKLTSRDLYFLPKPFSLDLLAKKVKAVFDENKKRT